VLGVTRFRHTSTLLALLLVLGGAFSTCVAAPGIASVPTDQTPHGDVLTARAHVEAGVVARPPRSPLPYASTSRSCDALAIVAVPLRARGAVPTAHRHTPLYALLRVYRL
jgi:hypothetical protein